MRRDAAILGPVRWALPARLNEKPIKFENMIKLIAVLILSLFQSAIVMGQSSDPLQLTLPPVVYAVPDTEISLYFANVVLTPAPETFHFSVDCALGQSEPERWVVTPKSTDVGTYPLTVRVRASDGTLRGTATTRLKVSSAEAGSGKPIRMLIVGDSLTSASEYPNELSRLLQLPANPELTLLGTHRPSSAAEGVAHEGYGGWTWSRFVSHYEPQPDPKERKISSPFVFLDAGEQPRLDVGRYIDEHCDGRAPDYVVFFLGINDCFAASPESVEAMDASIDEMFKQAEILLADFRKAAPQAHIGICLTPAANSRPEAFQSSYRGKYTQWGWKRIQHRLVQRQLEHFSTASSRNLSLIPTQLNIDPVGGYPPNNAVHPNQHGYQQIGTSIYAWLKSQL